jgi:hypothetical protein
MVHFKQPSKRRRAVRVGSWGQNQGNLILVIFFLRSERNRAKHGMVVDQVVDKAKDYPSLTPHKGWPHGRSHQRKARPSGTKNQIHPPPPYQ